MLADAKPDAVLSVAPTAEADSRTDSLHQGAIDASGSAFLCWRRPSRDLLDPTRDVEARREIRDASSVLPPAIRGRFARGVDSECSRLVPILAISAAFEDTLADIISWVVFIIVPVLFIALFWLVHILPEKYAHKRHHPQADAIHAMCIMSLFFGGLLWPLAMIWAFMKPPKLQVEAVSSGSLRRRRPWRRAGCIQPIAGD